ncbi:unnamed protein product, partial [Adineta ricciae]
NGEIWLDIEAYDLDNENFSSVIKIRLYRSSIAGTDRSYVQIKRLSQYDILQWLKHEYIIMSIACLMGLLFVVAIILSCVYCRRESRRKTPSILTTVTDDNSTKQKIIQTSSSEQSSSAGSLYGSEKSDNITVETSDMYLFSPKRTTLMPHPTDNLTNKLFHSIQTDLSLLTEANQQIVATRGTYV